MTETEILKKNETIAFVILAVFLVPILSVVIVGGYGFIVWISQILFGHIS